MFTHLHVHTEYSLLDGLSRIDPLVNRAKELGMDSLAITDHGALYGAIDFYRASKEVGIKPIIGCEMYVAPDSRLTRVPNDKSPFHLTVLAKNQVGYGNLVKLVTAAHLEGFYYKPRVDRELLERYHEGLIVLSGCPSGEVPTLISQDRMDDAKQAAIWYRDLFGDYYLELMEHGGVDGLPVINSGLMNMHRELGIPVVATNDSHYISREDAPLQDILICIHTNTNVQDERRLRMSEDSYYLKSPGEMEGLYLEVPDAISNTQSIADMCDLDMDFSQVHLPEYKVPEGVTADEYLARICYEGLNRRIVNAGSEENERLAYELEVIKQTQFANYFLVVWDIFRFTRESKILSAIRGSAAGSLALFCLDVTDVNPLEYRIVFERFLNVERKEMPDIDMDFQDDRREEVLNYAVSKYGYDNVAQIITFGTLRAKAAIRDVGRALAMPYAEVDRIARLVPNRLNMTLDIAMDESPELQEVYRADESIGKLVDTARSMEGTIRHASTHAAGVVISEKPLNTYVPLQKPIRDDDGAISMTQYSMEPVAALGLLKMDFLGLVNLTILADVLTAVSNRSGAEMNLTDIPLDDSNTFELLSAGYTVGVFQLEGAGMTRYIKELKPSSVEDVAAMIALYRPGPMEHIMTFIEAKHGRTQMEFPHENLRSLLEETYGVIVYQDQVFLIARDVGGYSLGEADVLRKAMGKKNPLIMAQEREKFIGGAMHQGYTTEVANEVFALIEPFAGYGFAKAHAVSYGLISYWTAYFKANYPAEYMASLLDAFTGNSEKLSSAVDECGRLKISVLPPNVNSSDVGFTVELAEEGMPIIRFGLSSIKNVGASSVLPIVEARKNLGSFESIEHMCREVDLGAINRKTLESLIQSGALDDFGMRGGLLQSMDRVLTLAQSEAGLKESDQASMFDLFGESVPTPLAQISIPEIIISDSEQAAWEKDLLGVSFSGKSVVIEFFGNAGPEDVVSRDQISSDMAGSKIVIRGQVSQVMQRFTRDQKPFVIATIVLMSGDVDLFVWENKLSETEGLWEVGSLVIVQGTVRVRGEGQINISCDSATKYTVEAREDENDSSEHVETVLMAEEVSASGPYPRRAVENSGGRDADNVNSVVLKPHYSETGGPNGRRITVRINESGKREADNEVLESVKRLLLDSQGNDLVGLEIAIDGYIVSLDWTPVRVKISPELEQRLRDVIGPVGQVLVE